MSSREVLAPRGDHRGRLPSSSSSKLQGDGNKDHPIILVNSDDEGAASGRPYTTSVKLDSDSIDDNDLPSDPRTVTPKKGRIPQVPSGASSSKKAKYANSPRQLSSSHNGPIDLTFSDSDENRYPPGKFNSAPAPKKAWFAKKTMAPGAAGRIKKAAAKRAADMTLTRKRISMSPSECTVEANKRICQELELREPKRKTLLPQQAEDCGRTSPSRLVSTLAVNEDQPAMVRHQKTVYTTDPTVQAAKYRDPSSARFVPQELSGLQTPTSTTTIAEGLRSSPAPTAGPSGSSAASNDYILSNEDDTQPRLPDSMTSSDNSLGKSDWKVVAPALASASTSGPSSLSTTATEKELARGGSSILTKYLGGLTTSQFLAQRTAEKLLRRKLDTFTSTAAQAASYAALITARLEEKAKGNAFVDSEDVRTESHVSSFLEDTLSKPETPSLGNFGVVGEYAYRPSHSQFCVISPIPTQQFDTSLQDMVNAIPESERNYALLKSIFESYIGQSTCVDEPSAPEITITNQVDREPKPPPFEFQYSNQVFYAPGVESPVKSVGCGCSGPCDPKSNSCLCVLRQTAYFYGTLTKGFAYEDGKRRPNDDISIWECSDTCGCPPECGNRVIQRGRNASTHIELFKTVNKGWGVRNGSDKPIPAGTFIGVYSGELLPEDESEQRAHAYNKVGRTYLFDLDGHQVSNPPLDLEKIDPQTAQLAHKVRADAWEWARNNPYPDTGEPSVEGYSSYSVDAFHWGNFARFFNHSCDPNLATVQAYVKDFHPERPILTLFAKRDILAYEELCISYHGVDEDSEIEEDFPSPVKTRKGRGRVHGAHVATPKGGRSRAAEAERALDIKDGCRCESRNCTGYLFSAHKTQ